MRHLRLMSICDTCICYRDQNVFEVYGNAFVTVKYSLPRYKKLFHTINEHSIQNRQACSRPNTQRFVNISTTPPTFQTQSRASRWEMKVVPTTIFLFKVVELRVGNTECPGFYASSSCRRQFLGAVQVAPVRSSTHVKSSKG